MNKPHRRTKTLLCSPVTDWRPGRPSITYLGKTVVWTDRFGTEHEGVIVKESLFAHCPGANSITILSFNDANLYGVPTYDCREVVDAPPGEIQLARARAAYKQGLLKYDAWQQYFANGGKVGF